MFTSFKKTRRSLFLLMAITGLDPVQALAGLSAVDVNVEEQVTLSNF